MSYSLREPEEEPVCECRYDVGHDAMDREDCPFHRDLVDDTADLEQKFPERKGLNVITKKDAAA